MERFVFACWVEGILDGEIFSTRWVESIVGGKNFACWEKRFVILVVVLLLLMLFDRRKDWAENINCCNQKILQCQQNFARKPQLMNLQHQQPL